jgi:SPP1 gp7 family putative phage head morphogenesis protein
MPETPLPNDKKSREQIKKLLASLNIPMNPDGTWPADMALIWPAIQGKIAKKLFEKNWRIWASMWPRVVGPSFMKGASKAADAAFEAGVPYTGEIASLAKSYFKDYGMMLCKSLTGTDLQHVQDLMLTNWGQGEDAFAASLEGDFIASESRLKMIYRSEHARAQTEGVLAVGKEVGHEYKKWLCAHDERSCGVCNDHDGNVVPMDEAFSGGYAIPQDSHPSCRCAMITLTEDDLTDDDRAFLDSREPIMLDDLEPDFENSPYKVNEAFRQYFNYKCKSGTVDESNRCGVEKIKGLPKNVELGPDFRQYHVAAERGAFTFKAIPKPRYMSKDFDYDVIVTPNDIPKDWKQFKAFDDDQTSQWYDPKYAHVETGPLMPNSKVIYNKLVINDGVADEPTGREPGFIFRGMAYEEFKQALETGVLKSKGSDNFDFQGEDLTFYSFNKDQAATYASGFTPWGHEATPTRPAVMVTVEDQGIVHQTGPNITGDEVAVKGSIPISKLKEVYFAYPFVVKEGTFEVRTSRKSDNKAETGSASPYRVGVRWEKVSVSDASDRVLQKQNSKFDQKLNYKCKSGTVDDSNKCGVQSDLATKHKIQKVVSSIHSKLVKEGSNYINGPRDRIMHEIAKENGFDRLPKVVSQDELNKYIDNGEILLYRGVSSKKVSDNIKTGGYYAGKGSYGSGIYCSVGSIGTARNFSGETGNIMRMTLDKTANIINIDDLIEQQSEFMKKLPEGSKDYDRGPNPDFKRFSDDNVTHFVLRNMSRFAAINGYDAISYDDPDGNPEILVLNRGALRVQDQDISGEYPKLNSMIPEITQSAFEFGLQNEINKIILNYKCPFNGTDNTCNLTPKDVVSKHVERRKSETKSDKYNIDMRTYDANLFGALVNDRPSDDYQAMAKAYGIKDPNDVKTAWKMVVDISKGDQDAAREVIYKAFESGNDVSKALELQIEVETQAMKNHGDEVLYRKGGYHNNTIESYTTNPKGANMSWMTNPDEHIGVDFGKKFSDLEKDGWMVLAGAKSATGFVGEDEVVLINMKDLESGNVRRTYDSTEVNARIEKNRQHADAMVQEWTNRVSAKVPDVPTNASASLARGVIDKTTAESILVRAFKQPESIYGDDIVESVAKDLGYDKNPVVATPEQINDLVKQGGTEFAEFQLVKDRDTVFRLGTYTSKDDGIEFKTDVFGVADVVEKAQEPGKYMFKTDKDTVITRGVLDPNAKIVDRETLDKETQGYIQEWRDRDHALYEQEGKELDAASTKEERKAIMDKYREVSHSTNNLIQKTDSKHAVAAMLLGYDAYTDGNYLHIINRGATYAQQPITMDQLETFKQYGRAKNEVAFDIKTIEEYNRIMEHDRTKGIIKEPKFLKMYKDSLIEDTEKLDKYSKALTMKSNAAYDVESENRNVLNASVQTAFEFGLQNNVNKISLNYKCKSGTVDDSNKCGESKSSQKTADDVARKAIKQKIEEAKKTGKVSNSRVQTKKFGGNIFLGMNDITASEEYQKMAKEIGISNMDSLDHAYQLIKGISVGQDVFSQYDQGQVAREFIYDALKKEGDLKKALELKIAVESQEFFGEHDKDRQIIKLGEQLKEQISDINKMSGTYPDKFISSNWQDTRSPDFGKIPVDLTTPESREEAKKTITDYYNNRIKSVEDEKSKPAILYRKGGYHENTIESYTKDPEGAAMQALTNPDEHIGVDFGKTADELKADGWMVLAGANEGTGYVGEDEVILINMKDINSGNIIRNYDEAEVREIIKKNKETADARHAQYQDIYENPQRLNEPVKVIPELHIDSKPVNIESTQTFKDYIDNKFERIGYHENPLAAHLGEEIGFGKPATIVTADQMDDLEKQGHTIMYMGWNPIRAEQFKTGRYIGDNHEMGMPGYPAYNNIGNAITWGSSDTGVVTRIAIDKNAKIIGREQLEEESRNYSEKLVADYDKKIKDGYVSAKTKDEIDSIDRIYKERWAIQDIMRDENTSAMVLGYDVVQDTMNSNMGKFSVINRGAVYVQTNDIPKERVPELKKIAELEESVRSTSRMIKEFDTLKPEERNEFKDMMDRYQERLLDEQTELKNAQKNVWNDSPKSNESFHGSILNASVQKAFEIVLRNNLPGIKFNYKCAKGTFDDSNKCGEDKESYEEYKKKYFETQKRLDIESDKIYSNIKDGIHDKCESIERGPDGFTNIGHNLQILKKTINGNSGYVLYSKYGRDYSTGRSGATTTMSELKSTIDRVIPMDIKYELEQSEKIKFSKERVRSSVLIPARSEAEKNLIENSFNIIENQFNTVNEDLSDYFARSFDVTKTLVKNSDNTNYIWKDPFDINSNKIENVIATMDKLINQSIVESPMIVHSGISKEYFDKITKNTDEIFETRTFMSTSRDEEIAKGFAEHSKEMANERYYNVNDKTMKPVGDNIYIADINLKEGSHAISLELYYDKHYPYYTFNYSGKDRPIAESSEVVIGRKSKFKVTNIENSGRVHRVVLENIV